MQEPPDGSLKRPVDKDGPRTELLYAKGDGKVEGAGRPLRVIAVLDQGCPMGSRRSVCGACGG